MNTDYFALSAWQGMLHWRGPFMILHIKLGAPALLGSLLLITTVFLSGNYFAIP